MGRCSAPPGADLRRVGFGGRARQSTRARVRAARSCTRMRYIHWRPARGNASRNRARCREVVGEPGGSYRCTHHIGTSYSHYICCRTRGERRRRPFRTDLTGVLDWLDHPESIHGTWSGGYPRNWSPKMETTAAALGMSRTSRMVVLELVLTETDGAHIVRLSGPEIRIPERIWSEHPSKVSGRFASLNLFMGWGLWRTLIRATKCRGYIRERKRAKRDFAEK